MEERSARIRWVRCPRCRQILPEWPNVTVYQCGGCGTYLQAKIRKQNAETTTSASSETNAAAETTNLDHVSQHLESSSSSQVVLHSTGECSLDDNNRSDHIESDQTESRNFCGDNDGDVKLSDEDENRASDQSGSEDCERQQLEDEQKSGSATNGSGICDNQQNMSNVNVSGEDHSSSHKSETLTRKVQEHGMSNVNISGEDNNSSSHTGETFTCNVAELGMSNVDVSGEDHNSSSHKSETLTCKVQEHGMSNVNASGEDHNSSSRTSETFTCNVQDLGMSNVGGSGEDHNNNSHTSETLTCYVQELGMSNEDCASNEFSPPFNGELHQSALAGPHPESEINDEGPALAPKVETMAEVDANYGIHSISGGPCKPVLVNTNERASLATDNLVAEQLQGSTYQGFDRVGSVNTFETTDFFSPSSEFDGSLIDMSKSPTTRSSRAYYGDGISSHEGTDDQLPGSHKHSSRHAYRLPSRASDVRPTRERFLANRNSASFLPRKTNYEMKTSNSHRNRLAEPTGLDDLDHPVRNWRRAEEGDYLYRKLFHQSVPLPGNGMGSTSNELRHNSGFFSEDRLAFTEMEKMRLLRMLSELRNQLDSTFPIDDPNGGAPWTDDHKSMYYDYKVIPKESLVYPRYSGRLSDGSNWPWQRKYTRIPFSVEAASSSHQNLIDNSSCLCAKEWHHSGRSCLPVLHHNNAFCTVHSWLKLSNSYRSCPSSPQQHMDSEFPTYSLGAKSDDQRPRDHKEKKFIREKHRLATRYLRPVAGGAPLIACPCCSKQLQLPEDFIHTRRRSHWLKCGACSEVLKFSLVNRNHLIPYTPSAEAPSPNAIHRRHFTSTSHVSDCPLPDSLTCSEELADPNPNSHVPFHARRGNAVEWNMSYSSTDNRGKGKQIVINGSQIEGRTHLQEYESAGPSTSKYKSKVSSEIEELPASNGSTLHRLMGYSSPSAVIFGRRASHLGSSSRLPAHGLT